MVKVLIKLTLSICKNPLTINLTFYLIIIFIKKFFFKDPISKNKLFISFSTLYEKEGLNN